MKVATGAIASMAHTANNTNDTPTIVNAGISSANTGMAMQALFTVAAAFGSGGNGTYGLGSVLATAGARYASNVMRHYGNEIKSVGIFCWGYVKEAVLE